MPERRPLYMQLVDDLAGQIGERKYVVGDPLPTEAALCATYGVGRSTVREALRRLEERGLIRREQGRNSRVTANDTRPIYVLPLQSEEEVLRYVADTVLVLGRRLKPVAESTADLLGLPGPDEWVLFEGTRRSESSQRVVAFTEVYIRRTLADAVTSTGNQISGSVFGRVLRFYNLELQYIDQTVGAVALSARVARHLGCEQGDPGLRTVRRFTAQGLGLFEVSIAYHHTDHFEFNLRVQRSGNS